jgi:aminobenzoyl-glutamate utilization protein B
MFRISLLAATFCLAAASAQSAPDRVQVLAGMDRQAAHFGEVSRQIWEFAEVGYKEVKSASLLKQELREAGFTIEENIGGIPTAFSAIWGQGKPVIGILGEYDALPELSQDATPVRRALAAGQPGHGCGHNLLGTASAFAAVAVKNYLAQHRRPGTIVFYGTPAEEGGAGKVFMARAGAFSRADVILTWHPGTANRVNAGGSLANINGKFRFHGTPSHAAAAPQQGRSALDGLLLMAHCVEMLREHVPQETRIHYVITNGGGAPNVVPPFAEGFFYARQYNMTVLDDVWERIGNCGQAGALGTGTKLETQVSAAVYSVLPNSVLAGLLDKNLQALGGISYSSEERAFAEQLRTSFNTQEPIESAEKVLPISMQPGSASTDVGDVSWLVPTAQFTTATAVPGTPGHSWQNVACANSTIGRKGMVLAAKTLALTALDLYDSPARIEAARKAFDEARAGKEYRSRIPADAKPPLDYRDRKPE